MRTISLTTSLCFTMLFCQAQFYKTILPPASFVNAVQKIVLDFRLDYRTIQDSLLGKGDQSEEYASKIIIPGAINSKIIRFHSVEDSTASYQAVIYYGSNYNEAARNYSSLVKMLKRSRMKWIDNSLMMFDGDENTPNETLNFSVSTLYLDIADPRYSKFCAQIEMVNEMTNWKVDVSFFNKQDDAQGATD